MDSGFGHEIVPLKILTQEKIAQASGANSVHKHCEIERFSLNEEQFLFISGCSTTPRSLLTVSK